MNKITQLRKRIQEQYENNDFESAAETGEALMREHGINPNEKSIAYADDLFNLAIIYDALGDWQRAVYFYYESAREVVAMEGDSLRFSFRLNNLAALLSSQGFSANAYHLLQHVTRIYRDALDADDPLLADGIYNMANVAAEIGKTAEAMTLHKEALRIRKESGERADVVNSLHSMAFILEDKNDNKRALKYAADAVDEAVHEKNGDDYYAAKYYLAELCDVCEDFEQSGELYREVLHWAENRAGRLHSSYINVSLRLANALARNGKYHEALNVFKEIKNSFIRIDGEGHLFYANCLRSMALLYRQTGEPDEAERHMMQSLKIRRGEGDDAFEDFLFLFEIYLETDNSEKALNLLVYLLMRFDGSNEKIINSVQNAHAGLLVSAIETLDDPAFLARVIKHWEEWEKESIND